MINHLPAILCSLLLPAGVAMALSAGGQKDTDQDNGDGRPSAFIVWDEAWTPVIR